MTRQEIQHTLILGSIFAFRMLGLFMILPVFSLYAKNLPNASPSLIGFTVGIYGLTQALFQFPFGIWSDYQSRRTVITIGLIIFALGSVCAAISHSLYGIMLGRALQGVGAVGSCLIALLADITSEESRTKAMAVMGITIGASFVLSIILGPTLNQWIGVPGLFWLTALLALFGLWMLWRYIPVPSHPRPVFNLHALPKQIMCVITHPELIRFNLSILISHALLTALFVILPLYLHDIFILPSKMQWHVYLPALLLSLLFVGKMLKKSRNHPKELLVFYVCIVCIVLSYLFLLAVFLKSLTSLVVIFIALTLFFTGFTLLEALLPSLVSKTVQNNMRGTATGLFSSCQFLGIFLGGWLGGICLQKYHYFGSFLAMGLLAFAWLLGMLVSGKKSHLT